MGVDNDGVVSSLPAFVVSNAAVEVSAIIAVDGVAKDFGKLLVDAWLVDRK